MGGNLEEWQAANAAAEADLEAREREALNGNSTPEELAAFARERDMLAHDRDNLADAFDERARQRDLRALDRDVEGSHRDRTARKRADDRDEGALDRFAAGEDRDFAAGDRGDSYDDRKRSSASREAAGEYRRRTAEDRDAAAREIAGLRSALETRTQIGQAQGLLMARHTLDPDQAFRLLVRLSQDTNTRLRDVAVRLITHATQAAGESTGTTREGEHPPRG